MKKIIRVVILTTILLLPSLRVVGQEVSGEQTDSLALRESINNQLSQVEGYSGLPDDAVLPITRDQAEELITKMILDARAPYVQERLKRERVNDLMMERLKERLLDQALRDTYLSEYRERLDRMERLLYAILLSKDNVDPQIINHFLQQPGVNTHTFIPVPGNNPAQITDAGKVPAESTFSQQAASLKKDNAPQPRAPRELTKEEAIPLAPGQPLERIEYFMSQVFFGFDSDELTPKSKKVLTDVAEWMKLEGNDISVSIRGFASLEGNLKYNNRLSAKRVKSVAEYLYSLGVPKERVQEIPSGIDSIKEEQSDFPNARRVEIRPILY